MRVLVTGAGGQLGGDLVGVLRATGHEAVGVSHAGCDVADTRAVRAALASARPDAVANCAAWTAVDAAEAEPALAHRVNAVGASVVAEATAAAGVRLLHVSTDYVFDGCATRPIDESASPCPASAYGASKLAGEIAVRQSHGDAQIVRTAWLYGRKGPNFVLTVRRLAREQRELRVVADQRGSPTWTRHLARAIVTLVERGMPGTFHITNAGEATWYDVARATLRAIGASDVRVTAIRSEQYPTAARRPAYSVLENRAWLDLGEPPLPSWRVALSAYLNTLPRNAGDT